jgi:hypothetical protein
MAAFMCSTDMSSTTELVRVCTGLAGEEFRGSPCTPALRSTALDCWGLLASTLPDAYISDGPCSEEILPLIKLGLDSRDGDLRASAGCAVALIHEARLNLGVGDDEAENTTDKRCERSEQEGIGLRQRRPNDFILSCERGGRRSTPTTSSLALRFLLFLFAAQVPPRLVGRHGARGAHRRGQAAAGRAGPGERVRAMQAKSEPPSLKSGSICERNEREVRGLVSARASASSQPRLDERQHLRAERARRERLPFRHERARVQPQLDERLAPLAAPTRSSFRSSLFFLARLAHPRSARAGTT